jgi:hypothetical protein
MPVPVVAITDKAIDSAIALTQRRYALAMMSIRIAVRIRIGPLP